MEDNNNKTTHIYALVDDNDNVRYVGESDNLNKRGYKQNWVNKMLRENREINIKILEIVPYDIWEEREIYWIDKYGLKNLVNTTIGGDGMKLKNFIKKDKNLKITSKTHKILKTFCDKNGLKLFDFVEKIINNKCKLSK